MQTHKLTWTCKHNEDRIVDKQVRKRIYNTEWKLRCNALTNNEERKRRNEKKIESAGAC